MHISTNCYKTLRRLYLKHLGMGCILVCRITLQECRLPNFGSVFNKSNLNDVFVCNNYITRLWQCTFIQFHDTNYNCSLMCNCVYVRQRRSQTIWRVQHTTHLCGHNHSNQCKIINGGCGTAKSVAALPHVSHPAYAYIPSDQHLQSNQHDQRLIQSHKYLLSKIY